MHIPQLDEAMVKALSLLVTDDEDSCDGVITEALCIVEDEVTIPCVEGVPLITFKQSEEH